MSTGSAAALEHVNHSADETVAVLDELAISVKVESLEEEAEASLY